MVGGSACLLFVLLNLLLQENEFAKQALPQVYNEEEKEKNGNEGKNEVNPKGAT